MPYGDRTGPDGFGPMTGRRLGYCEGYSSPGYTKGPGMGRGRGHGYGGGRGYGRRRGFGRDRGYGYGSGRSLRYRFRRWFHGDDPYYDYRREPVARPSVDEEKKYLSSVLEDLSTQVDEVKKRIEELDQQKTQSETKK